MNYAIIKELAPRCFSCSSEPAILRVQVVSLDKYPSDVSVKTTLNVCKCCFSRLIPEIGSDECLRILGPSGGQFAAEEWSKSKLLALIQAQTQDMSFVDMMRHLAKLCGIREEDMPRPDAPSLTESVSYSRLFKFCEQVCGKPCGCHIPVGDCGLGADREGVKAK